MSNSITRTPLSNPKSPVLLEKGKLWLVFVVVFFSSWGMVGQNTTTPVYEWMSEVNLPTVSISSLNTEDITISVATDPEGNVYTLTFGKGIIKRSPTGALINANFIPASRFDSPLDMAIDEKGFIYVADYFAGGETFADNGKIWVFDSNGTFLPSSTILTSFYRPMGLDVDQDKVYVAEFNDGNSGPEPTQMSRISIYDKNSQTRLLSTANANTPFRIAVDSQKWIYVSQAGSNNPSVRVFDQNLVFQNTLPNIISPGSIVIDSFDFIHVLEYDGRVDFSQFINFENLSVPQAQAIAKKIDEGQEANAFSIKIFDPGRVLKSTYKDKLDFPVDLTFNSCDRMYVNNAEVFGTDTWLFGYIPEKIEFDLEIYKRTPSFDIERPLISCTADIMVTAEPGTNFAVVEYPNATSTDNCGEVTVSRTNGPASGSEFPVGPTVIEFTAKDAAGSKATCSFTITVESEIVNNPPTFDNCPTAAISYGNDPEQCGAIVTLPTITASDDNGTPTVTRVDSGPLSGEFFPVGSYTIVFEADDGVNDPVQCSFGVVVTDNETPAITCPENITETIPADQNSAVVEFSTPVPTDNCSGVTVAQTAGQSSGSQFEVGNHEIVFTATDAAGNKANCSFTITVESEIVNNPPTFDNCPTAAISYGNDPEQCGAIVTLPTITASDDNDNVTVTRIDSGPPSGDFFLVGSYTIVFEADDGVNDPLTCTFNVIVSDQEKPTITCPGNITETAEQGETSKIINYNLPSAADNCGETVIEIVDGFESGEAFPLGSTTVSYRATDASGNTQICSFTITVELAKEPATFQNCPEIVERGNDAGECGAIVSFEAPTATDSDGEVDVVLTSDLGPGSFFPVGPTVVTFEATGSDGTTVECNINVIVEDTEAPVFISCLGDEVQEGTLVDGEFILPDYTLEVEATDNCSENLTYTQSIPAGTTLTEGTYIHIFAYDEAGNESNSCSFQLKLIEEPDPVTISCSGNQTASFDQNCSFRVPDYTSLASYTEGANITQSPAIGTFVTENTIIRLTATLDGETEFCEFELLLEDTSPPVFNTCPEDISVNADSDNFTIPDYTQQADVTDNCDEANITQFPAEGTIITDNTTITLKAVDENGNEATCSFLVSVVSGEVLTISCPDDKTYTAEADCGTVMPDFTDEITTNIPEARITQFPEAGFPVHGSIDIRFTAVYEDQRISCTIKYTMEDLTFPVLNCVEDQLETIDAEVGFSLPNYILQLDASDNCHIANFQQVPDVGTVIFEDTEITLLATDGSGNTTACSFMVFIQEENSPLEISCPSDKTESLGPNCSFAIPDYTAEGGVNFVGASVTQTPSVGTMIRENVTITLTATLGDKVDTCTFELILEDTTHPVITCPGEQSATFDPAEGFTVPDYRDIANPEDNCNFEWLQTPAPGTVIFESVMVDISATDDAGNRAWCSFVLRLAAQSEPLEITCPENKNFEPNENCSFIVPDYTVEASVNNEDAIVTQSPAAGTLISASTTIILTATFGDEEDTCTFELLLEDTTDPEITCPDEQLENFNPSTGFTLPNYRDLASALDNCEVATVTQDPPEGRVVNEDTQITLSVTDTSGNSTQCQFMVILSEEEIIEISCPGDQVESTDQKCQFEVPNYTDLASVNFENAVITQSPEPGEIIIQNTIVLLTATLDGKTDTCSFEIVLEDNIAPVANCVTGFGIGLGSSGTATLTAEEINFQSTDNCGIVNMTIDKTSFTTADVGENTVTLTVTDAAGNVDSCQTIVTVTANTNPGDFTCRTEINLLLQETGIATLVAEDLYTGDKGDRTFELSRSEFTCEDIGSHTVTLAYAGEEDSDGTCDIIVNVQDKFPPVVRTNDITVFLNDNGEATITPELIDNGSEDNCGDITLSLNITRFTCKDIGTKEVILTVVDEYGNSATATALVTVTGECEVVPPTPPAGEDVDYIFIYPNPTTGPFTFATPRGVKILVVEAFDARGRLILAKVFPESTTRYEMDLTGVQSSVYILKVITTEGEDVIRVIIK